jgi:basic membrane protein A
VVPTAQASTAVPGVTATLAAPATAATTAGPARTSAPATPTASATLSVPPPLIGYVSDASGTPGVLDAIQATANSLGWTVQSAPNGGAVALTKLAQVGALVIVADGADLEAATRSAAGAFPKAYFVGVGQAGQGAKLPNLLSLGAEPARQDQIGFMAGVVAGYATRAKVMTAVGYTTDAVGLKYRNGFLHGVRLACSRCRVDFVDVTDLNNGPAAANKARLNASLSSDVVFAAAGAASADALQAAAQAGAWVVGADSDVYQSVFGGGATKGADKVLASAYFDPGAAVAAALKAYQAGKPWSGAQSYSAATGAIALAPFRVSTDVLSDLDRSDINAALAQLADGSLDTGIDPLTGNEL